MSERLMAQPARSSVQWIVGVGIALALILPFAPWPLAVDHKNDIERAVIIASDLARSVDLSLMAGGTKPGEIPTRDRLAGCVTEAARVRVESLPPCTRFRVNPDPDAWKAGDAIGNGWAVAVENVEVSRIMCLVSRDRAQIVDEGEAIQAVRLTEQWLVFEREDR